MKSDSFLVAPVASSHIKGIGEAQGIKLGLATHQATQVLRLRPETMELEGTPPTDMLQLSRFIFVDFIMVMVISWPDLFLILKLGKTRS